MNSYCKKCKAEVEYGEICPQCGAALPASSWRMSWQVIHNPAADWTRWNEPLRIALPVLWAVFLLTALSEGFSETALAHLFPVFISLTAVLLLGMWLYLHCAGPETLSVQLNSKGAHITVSLTQPTALQLLLRFRSTKDTDAGSVVVAERHIGWKEIRRVQLWTEKCLILLYSPGFWCRIALPCTPFNFEEALSVITEKTAKKKKRR